MATVWRLLVDGELDGALNMGTDEALLESAAGGGPPTLRIYRWERPTVSLGRFQAVTDVDEEACGRSGIALVRRPTGGRAVLHDREVTYSVVAGRAEGVPRGTVASYAFLCAGLAEAFRLLGVPAELTRRDRGPRTGACYLHATRADLSLSEAKLSGSAQVWRGDHVLQHGSVVLARDCALESELFRLGGGGARLLAGSSAALEDVLGVAPSTGAVTDALVAGFASVLGADLREGELDACEARRARKLAESAVVEPAAEGRPAV